jgi:beta-lactamase regulating signal transducer with metallopeptidase domain
MVSVFLLIRLFLSLYQGKQAIQLLYTEEDTRANLILQNIIDQTKPGQDYTLHIAPDLSSPIVTGFFHPVILMPEDAKKLSNKQLYYILRHEWSHYLSKDLWVKLLIHILCCVMWWNPPVYLLKKDLNQILELNCDHRVTKGMKKVERLEYLQTIIEVLKQYFGKGNHMLEAGVGVHFVGMGKGETTIQRFQLVCDHQKSIANSKTNFIFALIMVILFLLSFSFILQPHSDPPPMEGVSYYEITPENAYLKFEENGMYTLYRNGKPFDSISKTDLKTEPYSLLPIIKEN